MKTLAARFAALKQRVGGNREKMEFEFSFGPLPEEKAHITRLSAPALRILSEINFALSLSGANGNRFDPEVAAALGVLESAMDAEAALTSTACKLAEDALMPLKDAAKEYELIYAAHAHIDMNWMWGLQETVAATLATFRTMLSLMDEYPEFTFMQSQGSVYKIVEKYDPKMMTAIKRRIAEGRWEVTASAWVETDKNMPDTESLLRHISVTRSYLKRVWGVDPDRVKVDFSPDTFGHSRFIPEINRFGGINPDNGTGLIGLSERCAGLKTGLIVYGVGDHGGGPTRRDVERIIEMARWPVFPAVRFGTLHEYFEKAEAVYDRLNVVPHELNTIFSGCYTTQSRIKLGNRRSETALLDAEKMCALGGRVADIEYPAERFDEAWQDVLFTHFHDILTGSCVQESREHAMALFAEALSYAQTAENNALRVLSESIDTSAFDSGEDISDSQAEGAGAGFGLENYAGVPNPERGAGKTRVYTVFNTASMPREDTAVLTIWDYTGDLRRLEVVDETMENLPFELLDRTPQRYWDHLYVRVLVHIRVPAAGYRSLAVREKEIETYPTFYLDDERVEKIHGNVVLKNRFLRAEFAMDSGALISLTDNETGVERLSGPSGLYLVLAEKRTNNAWNIGRHLKAVPVDDTLEMKPVHGALRSAVEITQKVLASRVKTIVSLDPDAKELAYSFEVDWNEAAAQNDRVPVLTYRVFAAGNPDKILTDVPGGCALRDAAPMDVAGLTFASARGGAASATIFTDCKYGYRLYDGALSCTLINSAGSPDPYPERGIHKIQLWLSAAESGEVALKHRGEALMRPLIALPTKAKQGSLPPRGSIMTFQSKSSVLSSVTLEEDGALRVRVFEMMGQPDSVTVELPFERKRAALEVGPHCLAEITLS